MTVVERGATRTVAVRTRRSRTRPDVSRHDRRCRGHIRLLRDGITDAWHTGTSTGLYFQYAKSGSTAMEQQRIAEAIRRGNRRRGGRMPITLTEARPYLPRVRLTPCTSRRSFNNGINDALVVV